MDEQERNLRKEGVISLTESTMHNLASYADMIEKHGNDPGFERAINDMRNNLNTSINNVEKMDREIDRPSKEEIRLRGQIREAILAKNAAHLRKLLPGRRPGRRHRK